MKYDRVYNARINSIGSKFLDVGLSAVCVPVLAKRYFGSSLLIKSPLVNCTVRKERRGEERLKNKPSAQVDSAEKRKVRDFSLGELFRC